MYGARELWRRKEFPHTRSFVFGHSLFPESEACVGSCRTGQSLSAQLASSKDVSAKQWSCDVLHFGDWHTLLGSTFNREAYFVLIFAVVLNSALGLCI